MMRHCQRVLGVFSNHLFELKDFLNSLACIVHAVDLETSRVLGPVRLIMRERVIHNLTDASFLKDDFVESVRPELTQLDFSCTLTRRARTAVQSQVRLGDRERRECLTPERHPR